MYTDNNHTRKTQLFQNIAVCQGFRSLQLCRVATKATGMGDYVRESIGESV